MKKIWFFLISYFFFAINVSASLGIATPKEYTITINNINRSKIESIEILYKIPRFTINYEDDDFYREWLICTDFGYKYKDYKDAEIIPTLTTEEIDEIAKCNLNADASEINGYWLETDFRNNNKNEDNDSITKYAIYDDVKIKFYNNKAVINFPAPKSESLFIKINKDDDTILYSQIIESKLNEYYDEHTPEEEFEKKIKGVENKIAQFEVDYANITNGFEVSEVEAKESIIDSKIMYIIVITIIIIIIIFLIKNFKKNRNRNH